MSQCSLFHDDLVSQGHLKLVTERKGHNWHGRRVEVSNKTDSQDEWLCSGIEYRADVDGT